MTEHVIKNPIIPGFYPDPSICRVGEYFYLIQSSFGLFPGIPVFRSRDLANWELIGNALDRTSQHYVSGESYSGGIMAPTIRWHNGIFYIIVSNNDDGGNRIFTATDAAGPWSDPVLLKDVPGIDASIFFDNDGKCYVHGTGTFDENGVMIQVRRGTSMENLRLGRGIWAAEFDIKTMKPIGEKKMIWDSALRNAWAPEAPHIYRRGDWYYLVIAEGGTEHFHAVTVARSKDVLGFYDGFEGNPVLTHRHLGYDCPIGNVGHADLVELPDGNWYAVVLASRIMDGFHKNLGRETYICPVTWERDWPVFSPGTGKVEWTYPAPASLPWTPVEEEEAGLDHFDGSGLAPFWCFMGTPLCDFWSVQDSKLELKPLKRDIDRELTPFGEIMSRTERPKPEDTLVSLVARRQRHFSFDFSIAMEYSPKADGEKAGLVIMQADNHMLHVEYTTENGNRMLNLVEVTTTSTGRKWSAEYKTFQERTVLVSVPWDSDKTVLKISQRRQNADFYYGKDENSLVCLYKGADTRKINPEEVGGMVGTMLGMYASSGGRESGNSALFDWANYEGYGD